MDVESKLPLARRRQPSLQSILSHISESFRCLAIALRPSIISSHRSTPAGECLHSTSYLNGIRGVAAFLVFIRHFVVPWQPHVDYGYGEKGHFNLLRLPFLRLFYAGPLVPILLIISGYVLSLKPLKLIHNRSWDKLSRTLGKSVFCRAVRLFLPPVVSTFGVMISVRLGLFYNAEDVPGRRPQHPEHLSTFSEQFFDWLNFVLFELTNSFNWSMKSHMKYGQHLWTIPITFRGSLIVLLTLLGLSTIESLIRCIALGALSLYCISMKRWEISLFLGGMILCEIDLVQQAKRKGGNNNHKKEVGRSYEWSYRALRALLLSLSLYIGSFPRYNGGKETCVRGFESLCSLTPDYHYWDAVAGLGILGVFCFGPEYQSFFNSAFPQYMSTISFSFYVIHEPFLQIVGFPILQLVWIVVGDKTWWMYQIGFGIGMIIAGLLLFWTAEVFAKLVERPCGRLAEWLYRVSSTI